MLSVEPAILDILRMPSITHRVLRAQRTHSSIRLGLQHVCRVPRFRLPCLLHICADVLLVRLAKEVDRANPAQEANSRCLKAMLTRARHARRARLLHLKAQLSAHHVL